MSIQSQIDRINTNIANAYDAVDTMGGTLPVTQNSANLPDAIATLAQTDYIQLEWIEGTGTQYIDTGITPNDNYIIEMTASNHSNDDTAFFGANDTWNSDRLLCYGYLSRVYFRGSGSSYISHDVTSSTPYTIRVSSSSFTVNGQNNQPQTTLGAINTTLKFFSGGSRIGKFRFYSAKVWNGNTLVGDYIPVLKKSTYDVGVYNKVDNTFINNSGLGTFKPGIKIAGYNILDYLYSSGGGNTYIDTGVTGGNSVGYELGIKITTVSQAWARYMGGRDLPEYPVVVSNQGSTGNKTITIGSYKNNSLTNYASFNPSTSWRNVVVDGSTVILDKTTASTSAINAGWGTTSCKLFTTAWTAGGGACYISYCRMYTDGVLVRDFIPAQRVSDSKNGLYDLVNNVFYISPTNSNFTAGTTLISNDGTNSPYYSIPVVVPTPSTKSGSIANQIDRINENIANAYDVCRQIGRTLPYVQDSELLEPTILDTLSTAIKLYYYLDTTNHTLYLRRTPKTGYTDGSQALNATTTSDVPWWNYPAVNDIDRITIEEKIYTNSLYYWFESFFPSQSHSGSTILDGFNLIVTKGITSMNYVFGNYVPEEIYLPNIDTSSVTSMLGMFSYSLTLKHLDLSNFDTSNVTTMERMFEGCSNLEYLDLSSFDMSNVTNTYAMFNGCSKVQTAYCRTRADKTILDAACQQSGVNWRFTIKS